jgi:peptide subunit release factor RF-3
MSSISEIIGFCAKFGFSSGDKSFETGDKLSFSGVTLCSPELFFSIFITDVFGNWRSSVQKR